MNTLETLEIIRTKALLFDLDGTLIDSLPAVERAWRTFAARHGLDPESIMEKIHGRRSIDSIRKLLPHCDALAEDAYIRSLESADTTGVIALPGTRELLAALPTHLWAIVTSGTSDVAMARCRAVGLPPAGAYVFGEDVEHGKPAPDPFLLAAHKLGFEPTDCVGFEDTVAGLNSIKDAGMQSVAIQIPNRFSVQDLSEIKVRLIHDEVEIQILS